MKTEVLVIGGGPAGTAAAIRLARGCAQVTLAERERVTSHKVCGEFLSGEALIYLKQLGVDLAGLGAVPLNRVRVTGKYGATESTLPFPAMSLTRRCLDGELLRRSECAGVQVRRGCNVERLVRESNTWRADLTAGGTITANAVFLATGKHDLHGYIRPKGKQHGMVAFKMYWRLSAAETRNLGDSVELISYRAGYAGLQPVENGLANLCCLIHTNELRSLGGKWDGLLVHMCHESPNLRQRLKRAEPQLSKPLTIASIPYGFVRENSDGLWYLGDQAAVIPSLTGDGMSIALHTGFIAADMYLQNKSANQYQQTVATHVKRQVAVATAVSKTVLRLPRLAFLLPRFWPGAIDVIAWQTRIDPAVLANLDSLA